MVDKTNPESTDSIAQKSSEEMFLKGSGKDEILRNKSDEGSLKLDDSQEELSLQNIQLGSEQREHPNVGLEQEGNGVDQDEYLDVKSGEFETEARSYDSKNYVDPLNNNAVNQQQTSPDGFENTGDDDANVNNDQDTKRVLYNLENDKHIEGQGQATSPRVEEETFDSDNNAPLLPVTDIPLTDSNDADEIVNFAPDAGDAVEVNINEGDSTLNGQIKATDQNTDASLSYQVVDGVALPDGFSLSNDGNWQFDAQDLAYDHLSPGDSVVLTIPVIVTDEFGESDTTQIRITVNGTNDVPVAGASVTTSVDEGEATITGQLSSSDVDDSSTASWSVSEAVTAPEGFSLNVDGSYSFDPTNGSYDHLSVGSSELITIPVTVTDEHGATDTTQIQITVQGTNDAPVAGASITTSVDEGAASISGQLTSTDLDDGATASWSVSAGNTVPDGFVFNSDGSYSFDPAGSTYDHLNVGDSEVITVPVTITDDNGATDTAQIQITVQGTNDAPIAGASVTASVDEGATVISGQLTSSDSDDGATASWSVSAGSTAPDGFVINADGSYSFDPADSAYDHLNVGDSEIITVPVTVTDDNGVTDTAQIQITVQGTNDAPTAIIFDGTVVDENASASTVVAQMSTQDVDDGESFTYSIVDDASGLFEVSGDQIVVKAGADVDFEAGASHEVSVQVTDTNGLSHTQSVTLTVNDINEAPTDLVFTGSSVDENSAAGTVVATLSTVDEDSGETFTYDLTDASGFFEISGDQIVVKAGAGIDFETAESHDISVQVTDSAGNTLTENFTININDILENLAPDAVDDVTEGFNPANATLTAEIDFDEGVPAASLGTVTTENNGQVDDAADFNAAKVEVSGLDLNGDPGAQTTVSMWVQANPAGGWEMLAASDRYDMVMLNGDIGFNTARGDLFGTDASELADGEWHHVVGVFTNGDVTQNTIHIDGMQQDMSQIQGTPSSSSANIDSSGGSLFFGSWGANNNYAFTGSMDEVKVFDGVLSSDEVTSLYDLEADNSKWDGGALSTSEDNVLTINPDELLANDTDPDGDVLTISSVQDGDHGTVTLDQDGNVEFTPEENYSGEATFTYTVSDGNGGEDIATVTLNVSSVNDLPVIDVVNTITVDEDGSQQFTYSTSDIDSSSVMVTGEAENGNVVVNSNGTVTFTPNENYFGEDTIALTATDSDGGVTTQEISVTVNPVDDAPDAVDDGSFEPLSATLTAEFSFDQGMPAASLGSVTAEANGQVGEAADFNTAKVEVSGLDLNSDAGAQTTVSMWIQANPSGSWEMLAASNHYDMVMLNGDIGFNTAGGDMFGTDASELADGEWHHVVGVFTNGDVTQNSVYIDGVEQQMSQIQGTPSNTRANIDSSGGSLFFGSWGANNNYSFTGSMDEIKVFNGALSADEVSTLHDIESVNTKWDSTVLSTDEDVALVIDPSQLLTNDTDVDGDTLSIVSVQDAQNGTVEIDGQGNVVFTPEANYSGEATFTYTIDDGNGNTDSATVTLNVNSANDAPVAGDDVVASVDEDAAAISGQLTSTDLDDGATASWSVSAGNTAPDGFVLNADGSFSFDPANSAYDHLNVGDSEVITVPVTVTDDNGATDTAQIQITVQGTNDEPIAGASVSTSVDEGAVVISGQLSSSDSDDGATAAFTISTGSSTPDGFVLNSDGSYSFDPADSAYNHLNVGDSEVITVPVTVTDDNGATDTAQIQITVSGTNDAPIAGASVTALVDEGTATINGQLTSSDLDDSATASWSVSAGNTAPDGFVLNTDGSYSFDPSDVSYDHLNTGDSATLTIPVTVIDDDGASDTAQIQITVQGTNDAPIAGASVSASVDEGAIVISGQLTSSDSDDGSTASWSISAGNTAPDGFVINTDGLYSFDPADSAYNYLNVGDSEVITVPVTVTDDNGATDTAQIQIILSGTNDVPVAGASVSASVDEGSVISGQLVSSDVDDGATASWSVSAGNSTPDGFVLNTDGSYSFDPSDASYNYLNVGDSATLTIPVTVTDDNGATDTAQIQITVQGTNDAPIADASVSALVDEGSAVISGQLSSSDSDDGATASWSISAGNAAPDGFVLNTDGSYSFDPANGSYDHLNVGDSEVITVPVTVTDDNGTSDTAQIQITVQGTNDAPIAGASVSTSVDEGAAVISGQLTSSDSDDGSTSSWSISAGNTAPDGFVINTDGSYSFDPANGSYNHLNVGDSEIITVPVTVTDDNGTTDTAQIQITLSGTNDVPVAGASVSASVDEGSVVISGQLVSSDVDDGATASWSVSAGNSTPDGFELNSDGSYSFDPANGSYDHLNVGDSEVITVPVTVTDDQGATDAAQIQITVNGTNDAPIAGTSVTTSVDEGAAVISGQLTSSDSDDGATVSWSISAGNTAPDGFVLNADGSYSFDPADGAYDHLNVGDSEVITVPLTVTDDNGTTDTSEIQVTVNGTNDAPTAIVFNGSSVDENAAVTTVVAQMSAQDVDDGESFSYSIVDDASGLFEVSGDQIVVKAGADINYEAGTSHDVTVQVTDASGASYSQTVTLTVNDVNDAPTAIVLSGDAVNENSAAGTVVATLSTVDEDAGETFSYALTDDASGLFEVSGDQIVVKAGADINYEADTSHDVTVQVTDASGASYSQTVTLTVNDVNDAPTAIVLSGDAVNENSAAGTVVATLSTVDEDAGETFSYALTDDASGLFEVSGDQLVVKAGAEVNYETGASHEVTVQVTDASGASYSQTVTLTVNNVNEAPTDIVFTGNDVDESSAAGTVVATLSTVDEDAGETFSYDLTDASGMFEISGNQVVVKAGADIDFETAASHDVSVQVTDSAGNVITENFTINVNDIVENIAPVAVDDNTMVATYDLPPGGQIVSTTGNEVTVTGEIVSEGDRLSSVDQWTFSHNGGPLTIDTLAESGSSFVDIDGDGIKDHIDTMMRLYDTDGNLVAVNDDSTQGTADGSTNDQYSHIQDSYLQMNDLPAGEYTLAIGSWELTDVEVSADQNDNSDKGSGYNIEQDIGPYQIKFTGDVSFEHVTELETDEDSFVIINVLGNDTDVNGDPLMITDPGIATDPSGNVVGSTEIVDVDGAQQIRFTPNASMNAMAEGDVEVVTFSYSISDGQGGSAAANVTVNVTGTNDSISAVVDADASANTVVENVAIGTYTGITLEATDADGDAISYAIEGNEPFTVDVDGRIITDGNLDFSTMDSYSLNVTATSADGTTSTNTFTVDVAEFGGITGTGKNDHLEGGDGDDVIYGGDGNDHLEGGAGNDELYGEDGNDHIQAGEGNDTLSGSAGNDRLEGGAGDDVLSGGSGIDKAFGEEGNDTYVVNPFDGSDYFDGGTGGGWIDAIDVSAMVVIDPDNPWTLEVGGEQVDYDLAANALDLNPDTSGVLTFADGSELSFDGVERIEW